LEAIDNAVEPMAPVGVILCGGQSIRMQGTPKALIRYHQIAQYEHVASLLKPFCAQVVLSIKEDQKLHFKQEYATIIDDVNWHGPLAGYAAALADYSEYDLLVVGVDYPFLNTELLQSILNTSKGYDASTYRHIDSGIYEPLCTLYRKSAHKKFEECKLDVKSLQHFLGLLNTFGLPLSDQHALKSVDTPQEAEEALQIIISDKSYTKK
jgi:molybdenum cofactor guanylyltransferase